MKFGDKLIALRKKNGLSQEDLAAKLNVSRQSVSKWESNNSYPETDKIVQICNIFDCSMDDLINENVTDLENMQRKNKNNINIIFDSFLEFISKTINMFCNMKFISVLKCIIEMAILCLIMVLIGFVLSSLFGYVISSMFSFLPNTIKYYINNIMMGIFLILWFIFSLIVLVHVFKIRYLDYYDKILNEKEKDNKVTNKNKRFNFERNEKIIIRDADHRPFAFLSLFSRIIIFFIKLMLAIFALFLCALFVFLVALFCISINLSIHSFIFIGTDIIIISSLIIIFIILILIFNFIFNKSFSYKIILKIFFISLILLGVGIGITLICFKNIEFKEEMDDIINLTSSTEIIEYSDDLLIYSSNAEITYVIDNDIDNIKLEIYYDKDLSDYSILDHYIYDLEEISICISSYSNSNIKNWYNVFINDLNNNIIRNYDPSSYLSIKVYAKKEQIDKMIENTKKVYNVKQEFDTLSNFEQK